MRESIHIILSRVAGLAAMLACWGLLAATPAREAKAQALEILNPPIQVKATTKASKKKRGNQAKFVPGSQETSKERSARLRRECQGAANAGACTGYTR
jgi:hypothetical protein